MIGVGEHNCLTFNIHCIKQLLINKKKKKKRTRKNKKKKKKKKKQTQTQTHTHKGQNRAAKCFMHLDRC